MNLEERVAALEKKLERVIDRQKLSLAYGRRANSWIELLKEEVFKLIQESSDEHQSPLKGYDGEYEEDPLVIHGQGEYAKKIYPSDLK